jgi:AcrR family transcriptional regulator
MIFTAFGYRFRVIAMRETGNAQAKPYHHGDLSRALVDAALRILEREGPGALSLRAVAREAGVSPAAPYHHFADKCELLDAVAHQGWEALGKEMATAMSEAKTAGQRRTAMGVAYVRFARAHPALYRVMGDTSREREHIHAMEKSDDDSGYKMARDTIAAGAGPEASDLDLELATIAAWCAAHGLAEMAGFQQFDEIKAQLGGEDAFVEAVLEHLGMFTKTPMRH